MRKLVIFILVINAWVCLGQVRNVAERLGYSKNDKLLIVHADDLGVAHSENKASIKALEQGLVNSASIMVPCPWFSEIAAYANEHQNLDFGLHLTITSEWKYYKWGASLKNDAVATLHNERGYFYDNVADVATNGSSDAVYKELVNQVETALDAGIDVTHLDTHMGALFGTTDFAKAYIRVGQKFKLPVLLSIDDGEVPQEYQEVFKLLGENDVVADAIVSAGPEDFNSGMEAYYTNLLNALQPGLNVLLIHLAYDDEEMQAITIDHPLWGAKWRQQDFNFFTSEKFKNLLEQNNIKLVTWKEIRDKITRS